MGRNLEQAVKNRVAIDQIRRDYKLGIINREEAKRRAEPVITKINHQGAKVARKLDEKYYRVNFVALMR